MCGFLAKHKVKMAIFFSVSMDRWGQRIHDSHMASAGLDISI